MKSIKDRRSELEIGICKNNQRSMSGYDNNSISKDSSHVLPLRKSRFQSFNAVKFDGKNHPFVRRDCSMPADRNWVRTDFEMPMFSESNNSYNDDLYDSVSGSIATVTPPPVNIVSTGISNDFINRKAIIRPLAFRPPMKKDLHRSPTESTDLSPPHKSKQLILNLSHTYSLKYPKVSHSPGFVPSPAGGLTTTNSNVVSNSNSNYSPPPVPPHRIQQRTKNSHKTSVGADSSGYLSNSNSTRAGLISTSDEIVSLPDPGEDGVECGLGDEDENDEDENEEDEDDGGDDASDGDDNEDDDCDNDEDDYDNDNNITNALPQRNMWPLLFDYDPTSVNQTTTTNNSMYANYDSDYQNIYYSHNQHPMSHLLHHQQDAVYSTAILPTHDPIPTSHINTNIDLEIRNERQRTQLLETALANTNCKLLEAEAHISDLQHRLSNKSLEQNRLMKRLASLQIDLDQQNHKSRNLWLQQQQQQQQLKLQSHKNTLVDSYTQTTQINSNTESMVPKSSGNQDEYTSKLIGDFEKERQMWLEEKCKVINYQHQIELKYQQLLIKCRKLESQLISLKNHTPKPIFHNKQLQSTLLSSGRGTPTGPLSSLRASNQLSDNTPSTPSVNRSLLANVARIEVTDHHAAF